MDECFFGAPCMSQKGWISLKATDGSALYPTHYIQPGLRTYGGCKYHRMGYIKRCQSFSFGRGGQYTWLYKRPFTCDSKNVLHSLEVVGNFISGNYLKKRVSISQILSIRGTMVDPELLYLPTFYYLSDVEEESRRRFQESRLINLIV